MSAKPATIAALARLTTAWASRGIDTTVLARAEGTLGGSDRRLASGGLVSVSGDAPLDALSREPLIFRTLLGAGGMGEVHLAGQPSLERDVAVKITLPDQEAHAEPALLKEALVGAHVEHPHVVPVHALSRVEHEGRDAVGLLMKRIEGRPWSRVIGDTELEAALVKVQGHPDTLALHVGILIRVCHAIAFAHSRGVLHLDLKPDNVMVGHFGEVYVLDWGLAAAVGPDAPGWLAAAADIRRIAGTVGYMAPELAAADGSSIDERTDVYLLGAVLHHALTHRPLHHGDSLMEMLGAAFASVPPVYGPEVPDELAAIVRRCVTFERKERFQSVTELREALEAFERHRPADRLLRRVDEGLSSLEGEGEQTDARVLPTLAECEIALEEARSRWAEHPRLAALDRAVAERRLRHALLSERAPQARALLGRLGDHAETYRPQIEALEARLFERDRHLRMLEELERDLDLTLGAALRTRLWIVLGAIWALVSVGYFALERAGLFHLEYDTLLVQGGLMIAVLLPIAVVFRRSLLENRAHRQLYGALALAGVTVELLWITGRLLDLPVESAIAITTLLYVYAFATMALVLDRRLFHGTLVMIAVAAFTALAPSFVHVWLGLGGLAAVLVTARAWRATPKPAPALGLSGS